MVKKNTVRITESELKKIITESAIKVLQEGWGMSYNDDGEPLGYEYERDPYEEEIAHWEEMDRRANDPHYAASQENKEWLRRAYAAFENQGIEVPHDVVQRLAGEMKKSETKKENRKKCLN